MKSDPQRRAEQTDRADGTLYERGQFKSPCGASLRWQRMAPADPNQPRGATFVLSNGIGGTIEAWAHLIRHFAPNHEIITWDYRGLFHSEPPPTLDGYRIEAQAEDLTALIEHFGVEKPILVGWSMGTQVNFEWMRSHSDRAQALIVVNGTCGHPFQTAFHSRVLEEIAPLLSSPIVRGLVGRSSSGAGWFSKLISQTRWPFLVLKAIGLLGATADEAVMQKVLRQYENLDFGAWLETFIRLGAHDATDVLEGVRIPTLIIAGERDLFTPPPVATFISERIDGSELYIVPSATHYCPLEYPELVSQRIDKFLGDHVPEALG